MSKGAILTKKNADFLQKKADIRKIERALLVKGIFSKTKYVRVSLCAKFQVSSIALTSFRQGGIPLQPQNVPLKSPPRLEPGGNTLFLHIGITSQQ